MIRETTSRAVSGLFSRRQLMVAIGAVAASALGVFVTSTFSRRNQKAVIPELVQPANHHVSLRPPAVLADLTDMPPEDRLRVELQEICANGECNERLGATGEPIKVVLPNKTVLFACSPECEHWVREHPQQAVAKLHALQYQHLLKLKGGGR